MKPNLKERFCVLRLGGLLRLCRVQFQQREGGSSRKLESSLFPGKVATCQLQDRHPKILRRTRPTTQGRWQGQNRACKSVPVEADSILAGDDMMLRVTMTREMMTSDEMDDEVL